MDDSAIVMAKGHQNTKCAIFSKQGIFQEVVIFVSLYVTIFVTFASRFHYLFDGSFLAGGSGFALTRMRKGKNVRLLVQQTLGVFAIPVVCPGSLHWDAHGARCFAVFSRWRHGVVFCVVDAPECVVGFALLVLILGFDPVDFRH